MLSTEKEYSEISTQDEGGDPNSAQVEANKTKQKSSLEPLHEDEVMEFEDSFPLNDESAWVSYFSLTAWKQLVVVV